MGAEPYCDWPFKQFLKRLKAGDRLENDGAPDEVYKLEQSCWALDARQRPEWSEIMRTLGSLVVERGDSEDEDGDEVGCPDAGYTEPPADLGYGDANSVLYAKKPQASPPPSKKLPDPTSYGAYAKKSSSPLRKKLPTPQTKPKQAEPVGLPTVSSLLESQDEGRLFSVQFS